MVRTFGRGERRSESVAVDGATERCRREGDWCVEDRSENRQDVFGDGVGGGVRVR